MRLGIPLSEIINEDLQNPEFRRAFLGEALSSVATGDVQAGKSVLRHYINGTVGFIKLGKALNRSPKSLMRMLSPSGNPGLRVFSEIVAYLQKVDKTVLTVQGIAA